MSSSRYRDDRGHPAYPPRHPPPPRDYYPSSSSHPHPYDSRGAYSSSSAYPSAGDRYSSVVGGRSHDRYDDRYPPPGGRSSYSSSAAPYPSSSRYDDPSASSSRRYDDRERGRPTSSDYRARSPPAPAPRRSDAADDRYRSFSSSRDPPPPPPASTSTPASAAQDPRAARRSAYRDLSPPGAVPLPVRDSPPTSRTAAAPDSASSKGVPPAGKASYERSANSTAAVLQPPNPPPATAPAPAPIVAPATPSARAEMPPPRVPSAAASAPGPGVRDGWDRDGWDRRPEGAWGYQGGGGAPPPGYGPPPPAYDPRGSPAYDPRGAYGRDPAGYPAPAPVQGAYPGPAGTHPPSDRTGYRPSSHRAPSPSRHSSSYAHPYPPSRPHSPSHHQETATSSSRGQPSPVRSSTTRRAHIFHPPSLPFPFAPLSLFNRLTTPSLPTPTSWFLLLLRLSLSLPSSQNYLLETNYSRPQRLSLAPKYRLEQLRAYSGKHNKSSGEKSRSKTTSSKHGSGGVDSGSKRAHSPEKGTDRHDKKAKLGAGGSGVALPAPSGSFVNANAIELGTNSRYPGAPSGPSSSSLAYQRPLPTGPAADRFPPSHQLAQNALDRPFYPAQGPIHTPPLAAPSPGPGVIGAPTGPRALRGVLPGNNGGVLVPGGPRVLVDVPKGPKGPTGPTGGRSGFAPIKTVPVAGPAGAKGVGLASVPTGPKTTGSGEMRKFFPGDEDEEELPKKGKRDEREKGRDRERDEERERGKDRRKEDRMDVDEPRPREREREREKEDDRGGWIVRNGGDVPPPRVRPSGDDDAPARPTAPRGNGHAAAGDPYDRRKGYPPTPTGPAAHARPPASYERPPRQSEPTRSVSNANAVPPAHERRWGAPSAAPSAPSAPATPAAKNGYQSPATAPSPLVQPQPRGQLSQPVDNSYPSRPEAEEVGGWTRQDRRAEPAPPPVQPSPVSANAEPSRSTLTPKPAPALVPATPTHAPAPAPVAVTATPATPAAPAPTELYERLVQVGEGTYGKVYKARNVERGNLVALKRIRMEAEKDGFPVTAVREIKLLQNLRHPNVVDLIEMLVSKGHVYMVFEYMDHDLTGVLHHPSISFTPAHLKSLMKQLLEGLGFIHRRGVLHRDLKGSNILLSKSGELKIADFGLARFFARGRNNDYTNRVITQWYKPPELLFGATVYGEAVDMWSAGCIFLELFARRPVFQGQDEIHQLEVIFKITGTPSVETWPGVQDLPWYELVKPTAVLPSQLRPIFSKWLTPAGLDVAERLLSLDPAGRPTADEALQMDYFTTEEPKPELPDILSSVKGEWHEYESKKARRRARDEAA
ncbi:hypothetical protein JCM1841_004932 [Sporobolomyces salmonicolor]